MHTKPPFCVCVDRLVHTKEWFSDYGACMELKPGYKQTELGVIPEEWEVKPLESFAKVTSGKRLPTGYFVCDAVTPHPYIRVTDMQPGGIDTSDLKYVPVEAFPPISKYRIFKEDLFISVAGTLGIVGKIPAVLDGANLTENANRISAITCDSDYLLHVMLSPLVQRVIESEQTVGAQPKLALMRIRNFSIPLPPTKTEQRAIAAALSDVDSLIASLDKLIAKKRDMKQAAMQELLTAKRRLPGFSGEWEVKRLGEICPLQRGFDLPTSQLRPGSFPVVYSNGVMNYHACSMVKGPGVITGRSGTIGNVHYVESDYWPHNTSLWVTSFKGNSPRFIFYLLMYIGLDQFGTGSGVPTLNRNDVHAHKTLIPPSKTEQTAIAAILSDMDSEIASLEQKRDKTRLLKQGMMQELLTGRIRLV